MFLIIPALTAGLGIWLMIAPEVLYYLGTSAAYFDRVVGPLLTAFAILTFWEILNPVRWCCAIVGVLILASPLINGTTSPSATVVHIIMGLLVVGLNLISRRRKHRYGGGWRALWKRDERWSKITWS